MNPTPKVYDKKLTEEHMVYIHSRTITLPTISGESLAKEIKEKFGGEVTGRSINNYRQEMGLKFRPPIRSVFISPPAITKCFNFSKYHIDNHSDFKNVFFSDES